MQYLYNDGDAYHFMDTDDATSRSHIIERGARRLGELPDARDRSSRWSSTATEPVGIELPQTVDLKVIDTAPGIKGATASAQVKPATLETGLVVQVPPFVNDGDKVRVNTETGRVPVAGVAASADSGRADPAVATSDGQTMDVPRTAAGRLDRSHHRQHVQRQERGADPPAAPRADRPPEGADLQAGHRQPLQRRPHRLAQRDADRVARTSAARGELLDAGRATTPRWSASTRGSSSTRDLPAVCNALANRGKRVIVAGLDQDYLGKPFEPMPQLLAIAEYITKTLAICMVCGNPANHTQRLVASQRPRAARRAGHLRGALPPLLRPVACAVGAPSRDVGLAGSAWPMRSACCSCFGVGFLAANLLGLAQQALRYWRRRRTALLTWPAPRAAALPSAARHRRRARACSSSTSCCFARAPRTRRLRRGDDVRLLRRTSCR